MTATSNRGSAMQDLQGKRFLITGSSRGIGRATALMLAESGCDVIINYLSNENAANEVADEVEKLGQQALVVKADMSEPADIQQMIDGIADAWGTIDGIVSNAAGGGFRNVVDGLPSHFDRAMHINARPLMLLAKAASVFYENRNSPFKFVALSSHGSQRALPAYGLIGASKAALESLIRHLAYELGRKGVYFNCVLGGLVRTDATLMIPDAEAIFKEVNHRMLLAGDRQLMPEDIAPVIRFLLSADSDLIQGQTIIVDGGACLHG
jgi:enoyl-[acyl-carrier protein] reductase III